MKGCLVLIAPFFFHQAAIAQNYVSVWQLGTPNNSQAEFAQEDGNSSAVWVVLIITFNIRGII